MTALRTLAAIAMTGLLAAPSLAQLGATRQRGPLPPAVTRTPTQPRVSTPGSFRHSGIAAPKTYPIPNSVTRRPVPGWQGNTGHGHGHGHHDHGHQHHGHNHDWRHRHSNYPWYGIRYPYSSVYVYSSPYLTTPYYYDSTYDSSLYQLESQNSVLRQQLQQLQQQNNQLQQGALPPNANNIAAQRDRARYQQTMETATRLFEIGSYTRAAQNFREAIRYQPDDATPRFFLAQSLFASGQYNEAVTELKTAMKVNPDWLKVDFDMRTLYQDPGDMVRQMAKLGTRLKANPLDRDALFLLGFELYASGEKQKAQAILEQANRLEPGAPHLESFLKAFDATQ